MPREWSEGVQRREVLPEDASLEDVQYSIYVRQRIEQGLADASAGRVAPHDEVVRRLQKRMS